MSVSVLFDGVPMAGNAEQAGARVFPISPYEALHTVFHGDAPSESDQHDHTLVSCCR